MRVTHVITRLIVGGAQENTIASVLGLRQKFGLDTRLVSGDTSGPEGSLESLVDGSPDLLTKIPELVRNLHPWKDTLSFKRLLSLFRSSRPDIVHTHSGKAGVLGRLAAARAGVPLIVHTIHGPSFGPFQGYLSNIAFRSAERLASGVTAHFVVVADAMKQQYLAAGIGRPEQYTRIFSGFALEPFLHSTSDLSFRSRLGIGPEDIVIGKIARIFKLKGHDALFAAAPALVRDCPQIKFMLVGDGEWRPRFEQKVRELGLQNYFRFTGLVQPSAVAQYIGIMDILVHLSAREGLARALPQAMAAGKPVIAFDCDGAKEVCRNDDTGFLVQPGDLAGLHQRILQLARNPALRDRFGTSGQKFVRERFSVNRMIDELHALYLRLRPDNSAAAV